MMLRIFGSASKPKSRSGDDRWKKLSAFDWTIWARFMIRRRSAPVGGGSTAMIWSTALADAIRWLTGQMPQMRAMIEGISWTGRPCTIRSKPRNWVTWNWASRTSPASSRWMVILEWPSIRVTGSMTIRLPAGVGIGYGVWVIVRTARRWCPAAAVVRCSVDAISMEVARPAAGECLIRAAPR